MKKITKISIISVITIFLIFLGFSRYSQQVKKSYNYTTMHTANNGAILFGGMSQDKNKIESFKKDFEKKDYVNIYWDYLHTSDNYSNKGDYANAVIYEKKALELAILHKATGDEFQARSGLSRLYEKMGQYDDALSEYNWIEAYQKRILNESIAEKNKMGIAYREKLLNELNEGRKRVEELKAKSDISKKVE